MIRERQFREENKSSVYIDWLNDKEAREGNNYMLVVTDWFDCVSYPVFCPSALLEETRAKYDNKDKMSRVDVVIQLQRQRERYTIKVYVKSFVKMKKQEIQSVNQQSPSEEDIFSK